MSLDSLNGYKRIAARESIGTGVVGIQIFVKISREFTEKDGQNFSQAVEDLDELLKVETVHLDPTFKDTKSLIRQSFANIFGKAGLLPIYMHEIPNEYCGRHCCLHKPWYIVTTPIGHFKIGWRKSVMNIDWSQTEIKALGDQIFAGQAHLTTIGDLYIHAWTDDQAVKWLKQIASHV